MLSDLEPIKSFLFPNSQPNLGIRHLFRSVTALCVCRFRFGQMAILRHVTKRARAIGFEGN